MDAIAVTLVSQGRYIGVAPLGTSLTDEQAAQLCGRRCSPNCRNRRDVAGRIVNRHGFDAASF
jgi:hypothetical protein